MQTEEKADSVPEIFRPNHALYRALLFIAILITIIAAIIPQTYSIFSVLVGIGSGGIASVVVAWLIDISTCIQNNKKTANTRKIVFSQLRSSIKSGSQVFILQCFRLGVMPDFDSQKPWLDWITMAYNAAKCNVEETRNFCVQCWVLVNSIKEQTSIINSQTVSLLDSGAIDEEEQQNLSAIINLCDILHSELTREGVGTESATKCLRNLNLLHGMIANLPIMCDINHEQIPLTLFQSFDKETLRKIYCSEEEK